MRCWLQMASQGINENYARETDGVAHGWRQRRIYAEGTSIEVAKCFTGWTLNKALRFGPECSRGRRAAVLPL